MKFTNASGDDRVLLLTTGAVLVAAGAETPDLTAEQAEGIAHQDIWTPEKSKPAKETSNG